MQTLTTGFSSRSEWLHMDNYSFYTKKTEAWIEWFTASQELFIPAYIYSTHSKLVWCSLQPGGSIKGKDQTGKLNVQAALRRLGGPISLTTNFIFVYLQSTSPFCLKLSLCGFMHLSLWHFLFCSYVCWHRARLEKVTAQDRVTASHTAGYLVEIHPCDLWRCMHVCQESLHDQVGSAGASPSHPPPSPSPSYLPLTASGGWMCDVYQEWLSVRRGLPRQKARLHGKRHRTGNTFFFQDQ